ncbi:unnamed protein product [Anisakis simplex]|uniref:acetate--CoA ligase n=1 Tax=Anisakis simplex TaxID=6269 RepID=A0A0M3KG31_ANISI|nr:unnamed protein product [Anisakis simplex]
MTVMGLLPLARLPGSTWQLVARRCAPILKKQLPTTAAVVHDGHHQSKRHLYTEGLLLSIDSFQGLEWNFDYRKGDIFIHFMKGAYTNAAYNCLERNIDRGYGSKVAYYWEGNEPADSTQITYQELADKVSAFAEVLRSCGIRKGDVVAIYLPMILELPISMLACAHIGAVHSVVFAGFGADALASRLMQAKAKVLVACDGYFHGKKLVHAKSVVDAALDICKQKVFIYY